MFMCVCVSTGRVNERDSWTPGEAAEEGCGPRSPADPGLIPGSITPGDG